MFAPVHTDSHNGIPVYWADLPDTLTGTLTFGVGIRDEPVLLAGITHLLEHLVFRLAEPILLMHDGSTDEDSLTFFASGTPDQVKVFLNSISEAINRLGDLTEQDIAFEKSILESEIEGSFLMPNTGMLTYRFGARSIGMTNFGSPSTIGLSKNEILYWAKRWLTTENAALTFTGPVPTSLKVVLPSGTTERQSVAGAVIESPLLVESVKEGVALSIVAGAEIAPFLGDAIHFELENRLRHLSGLIYSVKDLHTRIDNDRTQVDFILDPTSKTLSTTLRSAHRVLHALAAEGFSDNAVTYTRNQCEAQFGWRNATVSSYLDALALGNLLGRSTPTPEEVTSSAASLKAENLTEALREALPSLVVAYSGDDELDDGLVESLGMPFDDSAVWQKTVGEKRHRRRRKGTVWRSRRSGDMAGCYLSHTEEHLLLQAYGEVRRLAFSEIVAVGERGCGCLELVDYRGRNAAIDPEDWHRGKELVAAVLSKCPSGITREYPSH